MGHIKKGDFQRTMQGIHEEGIKTKLDRICAGSTFGNERQLKRLKFVVWMVRNFKLGFVIAKMLHKISGFDFTILIWLHQLVTVYNVLFWSGV